MSKRRITAEMLTQKDACTDQIDRFRERFPDGVDPETVQPEEVIGLDVWWAVFYMLPAPAWEAYKEAVDAARKAYSEAWAEVWKAYEEPASVLQAYAEATRLTWEAYREARARAAIELFREYWR